MSREEYRRAVREGLDVDWKCNKCSGDNVENENDNIVDNDIVQIVNEDANSEPHEINDICESPIDNDGSVVNDENDFGSSPINLHRSNEVITYEKVESCSQRGEKKLIDSLGYSYTVKRKTNVAVHWRCVVRNKKINCKATIKEKDTEYERGHNPHCHPPETCPLVTAKVSALVKKKAMDDMFRSASDIVDEVLCDIVDPNQPLSSLPAPHNLAKQGNRKRRGARPAEPLDLDFELNEDHLPQDFLQCDVSVSSRRHLIFSTQDQLSLLSRAKHWYADATFKVVRHPFTQLFSLHTFVQCDNYLKQVPLLFVLMSGKRKKDYKKVFAKIIELLGDLKVEALTIDFEKSVWRAVAEILPHVVVRGCSFHWGQAVWRYSRAGITSSLLQ